MRLDKLVDVSVGHPFGYHRNVATTHYHSQQWEDIRMVEAFPHYNLFAEPLYNRCQLTKRFWRTFGSDPLW